MPYIDKERRQQIDEGSLPASSGELNYVITQACTTYLSMWGMSYHHINEIVGVLECVKLELYRRIAAPYENVKKVTNGDVYPNKLIAGPPLSAVGNWTTMPIAGYDRLPGTDEVPE